MAEKKPNGEAAPQTAASGTAANAATGEKVTKVDAVGRAVAALGETASRADIKSWVKEHFGHDMSLDHISSCKKELSRRAEAKKAARKPAAKKAEDAKSESRTPVPAQEKPASILTNAGNSKPSAVEMTDIRTVRELLDRVGADHLRTLIDFMTR